MIPSKTRRGILAPLLVLALLADVLAAVAWIADAGVPSGALWLLSTPENLWVAWLLWGRRRAA